MPKLSDFTMPRWMQRASQRTVYAWITWCSVTSSKELGNFDLLLALERLFVDGGLKIVWSIRYAHVKPLWRLQQVLCKLLYTLSCSVIRYVGHWKSISEIRTSSIRKPGPQSWKFARSDASSWPQPWLYHSKWPSKQTIQSTHVGSHATIFWAYMGYSAVLPPGSLAVAAKV